MTLPTLPPDEPEFEEASDRARPSRAQLAWELDPSCALCGHVVEELEAAAVVPYDEGDRVAHRECARARKSNVPHRPIPLPLG